MTQSILKHTLNDNVTGHYDILTNPIRSFDIIKSDIFDYDSLNYIDKSFDAFGDYFRSFLGKLTEQEALVSFPNNELIPFYISTNDTNYIVSENEIMENRLHYLKAEISPLFISLVKTEDFEFGQKSESIKLVENELKTNKIATQNWLNDLYIQYFSSDEKVLIGILRIIEYFDEETLYPISQTIALASLVNKNDEIKEICIRIFENWGSLRSYQILKGIKTDTKWLQLYINQVIKDIEKELCLS
jgi:hypothetical protein